MWLVNWLQPEHPPNQSNEKKEKVRELKYMLDNVNRWPKSHEAPELFNLIDWKVKDGKMYAPVYLSGVTALHNPPFMEHVGAVVSIIDTGRFPRSLLSTYITPEKGHLYLPLDDHPSENIGKYLERAYEFIKAHHDRDLPVLIHCAAGMSRSATVAAYYMMRKYGLSTLQALALLKSRRAIIRPNDGFLQELVQRE